ncbi:MAG: hypothetical protein QOH70_1869 [Blastocatellia bacterium]|jgi:hypothetical protein|nr:hypothetical protein [Blastocatellia bacterium]
MGRVRLHLCGSAALQCGKPLALPCRLLLRTVGLCLLREASRRSNRFHWLVGEASLTALGGGKPPKPEVALNRGEACDSLRLIHLIPFVVECHSRTVEIKTRLLR